MYLFQLAAPSSPASWSQSSARRTWTSGWLAKTTRRRHLQSWWPKPGRSTSSMWRRTLPMRYSHHTGEQSKHLTVSRALTSSGLFINGPAGQLGCGDQRGNEAERRKRRPVLFRRSPEGHLHLDGERLLQTLSSFQADAPAQSKLPSGEYWEEKL